MSPIVGIGVIIWKDSKFLIAYRRSKHGQNTWSVPGGKLDFNESFEECAKREVAEETDLKIDNISFVAVTNNVFKNEGAHSITIWLNADWVSGEPTELEPDKIGDFKWTDFKHLPSPLFEPCWQELRKVRPDLFA